MKATKKYRRAPSSIALVECLTPAVTKDTAALEVLPDPLSLRVSPPTITSKLSSWARAAKDWFIVA